MIRLSVLLLLFLAFPAPASASADTIGNVPGTLPLIFERNAGQTDPEVKFLSRGPGYTLFLTADEMVLGLTGPEESRATVVRMKLLGANRRAPVAGMEELPGKVNYFIGNDPARWRTNVPTFARVKHADVYPGVDLVYYGSQRTLEYDFVVAPGADPKAITLAFDGPEQLAVDAQGDLVLQTARGDLRLRKPLVYQEVDGARKPIAGNYIVRSKNRVGFQVAAYDTSKPLVIDPVLAYSSYLGGSGTDIARGIAADRVTAGVVYVTGETTSANFPTSGGSFQPTFTKGTDCFIAKFDTNQSSSLSSRVYATYLGGSGTDQCWGIAVDGSGNAYIAGQTTSTNFPGSALSKTKGGGDIIVVKLNPTGSSLVYSAFLGGSAADVAFAIAVDAAGQASVTGKTASSNFPVVGGFQASLGDSSGDAFVAKLNAAGTAILYSTYLGGNGTDQGQGIAADLVSAGVVYVTGTTSSTSFPTTPSTAFDTALSGASNAFVVRVNTNATGAASLVYSTYLGGNGTDRGQGIATDGTGHAYVTGTTSSTSFPTTLAALETTLGGASNAFVARVNTNAAGATSLVYSTYLGGSGTDQGLGIATDGTGHAYVTGSTTSADFPTTRGTWATTCGTDGFCNNGLSDAFVARVNTNATGAAALVNSTFLGGSGSDLGLAIALDAGQNAYVTGQTSSTDFPLAGAAFQITPGGSTDAFVAMLHLLASTTTAANTATATFSSASQTLSVSATVISGAGTVNEGTVTFTVLQGSTSIGTPVTSGTVTSGNATATYSLPGGTAGGSYTIQAVYSGGANFSGSSGSNSLTVNQAATTTAVTAATAPFNSASQALSVSATVISGAGTVNQGTVTFTVLQGPTPIGTPVTSGTVTSGNATATYSLPGGTAAGSYTIQAAYSGGANFSSSGAPPGTTGTLTVQKATPGFGNLSSPTIVFGATPTVLSGKVTAGTLIPTGSVAITANNVTQNAAIQSDGSFSSSFATGNLSAATSPYAIAYSYAGDANFNAVSPNGSGTLIVTRASTSMTITTTTGVVSQPVTIAATVAVTPPGAGTPTGSVTFFDGTTTLGSGTLAGGTATTTAAFSVGTHSISGAYSGDANFLGTSGVPSGPPLTISQGATATTLTASSSSSTQGQSITFTATVSPVAPATGTPDGTVTFKDYDVALGTGTLIAGQATLATSTLGVGLHSLTATYNGSASFLGSTSAVSGVLAQPVISAPTVLSTDRTTAQPLGALYVNCKSQFVLITGTGFLPPTVFPPDIVVTFTPSTGITIVNVGFVSSTTLTVQVDVDASASGSRTVSVTNPDNGVGTSAGTILDVGNPQPCPAQGLAPSSSSSGTATPPSISGLTPSSGLRGSTVTVNGSNFGTAPAVTFTGPGGSPVIAAITSSTSTSLTVTAPAFPSSTADAFDGPVFVTNNGLASNGVSFTVTNPRLSVVSPSSAPPGSVTLDLGGTKLQSGATVQFFNAGTSTAASGITVTSVTRDSTGQHLTVGLSATAVTGLLDVVVTNPDSGSSRLPGAFQVKAAPAAGFTFSVGSADAATYLPSVDAVSLTLDSTGKCTAKSITPHAVTLTANFTTTVGAPPPSQVTFSVVSSSLPGTATNEDCELATPASNDFSVSPLGGPPDVTIQQVANVLGGGSYSVTLYSWDWGGNVTISVSGVTTVNGVANTTVSGTLSLPVDTDGDKLPDAYEANAVLNTNAAGQNVLDRLNRDQNGNGIADGDDRFATDGLSNLEKYRGVYLSGPVNGSTGQMTGLTRLGAGLRHLFVRGRGFGNDPAILAAPGTCGITVGPLGPSDPSTGTPVVDATLSASNPCPVFQVGSAFFAAGVQVHDVSASFTPSTTLPRRSLATPANPTLDMMTLMYDGVNCGSAAGCDTTKTGSRNWNFSPLGVSSYGTASAYGPDSRVLKQAVDRYFSNRPYQRRTAGLSPCTPTSTTPCFVVAADGTPMLTPLSLVGDLANDNGVKDTAKEAVDAGGQLLGDTYVAGNVNQHLSAMDATNDGCVELPFVSDPRAIPRCPNPAADSASSPQATKQQVVRGLITHEIGHNAGINTHTTDATDIMYQYTTNWIRDGHFSPTAAGLLQIHNKGIQ